MICAFKTQLFPNNKHRTYFHKACGVSRFAWNWGKDAWDKQYALWESSDKTDISLKPSGLMLKKQLNAVKKAEFPWMYEVTKYAAQQPFINLQRAWLDFFNKKTVNGKPVGKPKFKKKGKCIIKKSTRWKRGRVLSAKN